jgi:hypothetical protein
MADSKRKAMKGTANSEWMSGFLTADELVNGYTGVEIRAGEGNDGLGGTALGDELHGEGGNDQLHGHGGNDTLYGGEGDDTSYGGDGDDVLEDLQGRNGFYGGNGNDIIRAGEANDTIAGEGGDDRVWAGGGHNTVWLGEGHDFVEAGAGNDTITGDGGNDEIRAGGGDNTVYAGFGNDTVVAGDGRDRITGDDGHDSIEAGGGNDTIYAGSGHDTIDGGSGNDFITSDAGHDVIRAGSGSDTVYAGDGDDRVIQNAGENTGASDLLDGGSGIDTLVLSTTEDQYLDAAYQQELSRYKTLIANGSSAWQQYKFASLGLTVNGFEKLELVNHGPSEFGDKVVLQSGTEDNDYRITTEDLVTGYRDVDGDALKVSGLTATNGTITDNHDGTYTFTPAANYNGSVTLSYSVTDGKGGIVAASQSFEVRAVNDAPAGHISITRITVAEGSTATFTLTRTGNTDTALEVSYSLAGTATAGSDFTAPPSWVVFAAGETTATVTVQTTDDAANEADETIVMTVAQSAKYTITEAVATATILDNDEPPAEEPMLPTLSVNDAIMNEDGGNMVFTVSLSAPATAHQSPHFFSLA